mgnify:FL=1
MKIRDLNDQIHNWNLNGYVVSANEMRPRSKLHLKARDVIRDLFPTLQILEEVMIPITRFEKGFLDFYINTIKCAIEVHGQQHYSFNSLFHTSAQDFVNQKKKDRRKQEWCRYNNITCIELPYNEDEEKWRLRIQQRND